MRGSRFLEVTFRSGDRTSRISECSVASFNVSQATRLSLLGDAVSPHLVTQMCLCSHTNP